MYVIVPEGVSTCRSKSAKGECGEKVYDYVTAYNSLKGEISQMKVVEAFASRPHKAVSFVVERGKEIQEWNELKLPKVLPGYSGGRLPGRSTKEKGREEGEVDEDGEERRIRGQIVQEVVAGIKEKVSVHDGEKNAVKRPVEQSFMRRWTAHRLTMKKKSNAGEKGSRWRHSGMKSKNWRRFWNEGGWKEAPCSWRSCKMYLSYLCMNACHKKVSGMVYGRDEGKAEYRCGGRY